MSYTIMYGKQFIKVIGKDGEKDKYIPMIFTGSNNCTMFYGGREIFERKWGIWNRDILLKTKEEILEWAEKSFVHCEYELFKEGSKWITGKEIMAWFRNALNKADTLENILEVNPYRYINAVVTMSHKTEYGSFKRDLEKHIKTTEDLLKWLDEAYKMVSDKNSYPDYNKYIHCGFDGIEKIIRPTHYSGSVIVKIKGAYLMKFSEESYTCSYDKKDAIIFPSTDDAKNMLKDSSVMKWHNPYKFIKA